MAYSGCLPGAYASGLSNQSSSRQSPLEQWRWFVLHSHPQSGVRHMRQLQAMRLEAGRSNGHAAGRAVEASSLPVSVSKLQRSNKQRHCRSPGCRAAASASQHQHEQHQEQQQEQQHRSQQHAAPEQAAAASSRSAAGDSLAVQSSSSAAAGEVGSGDVVPDESQFNAKAVSRMSRKRHGSALEEASRSSQDAAAGDCASQNRGSSPGALLFSPDVSSAPAGKGAAAQEAGFAGAARLTEGTTDAARASMAGAPAFIAPEGVIYPQRQRNHIRESWASLMRWSKVLRRLADGEEACALEKTEKVVVFGGGSFGTAMGAALARQRSTLSVTLLLRDGDVCRDINERHINTRYLQDHVLPPNVTATTSVRDALAGAQYAVHAVPVQHSREFLTHIKGVLPPGVPILSVSKGLEAGTGKMMSDVIPDALGRKQPCAFLSGPSFAREVMNQRPTAVVCASKDPELARVVQQLFASPYMRVNTTSDVVGVEICGALKNVLAIAAGIVEGLELGHNAMAALVAQGCAEIRWLAEKMGAKPATVSGLSGLGDIMLTCYGSLSRNRSVGVRLGAGEQLEDILASSKQVAEGVTTAGVVVSLARKYRVSLPVLTATAQVLNSHLSAKEAVFEIMNLPQVSESE